MEKLIFKINIYLAKIIEQYKADYRRLEREARKASEGS
jgi:hypothetical protein